MQQDTGFTCNRIITFQHVLFRGHYWIFISESIIDYPSFSVCKCDRDTIFRQHLDVILMNNGESVESVFSQMAIVSSLIWTPNASVGSCDMSLDTAVLGARSPKIIPTLLRKANCRAPSSSSVFVDNLDLYAHAEEAIIDMGYVVGRAIRPAPTSDPWIRRMSHCYRNEVLQALASSLSLRSKPCRFSTRTIRFYKLEGVIIRVLPSNHLQGRPSAQPFPRLTEKNDARMMETRQRGHP